MTYLLGVFINFIDVRVIPFHRLSPCLSSFLALHEKTVVASECSILLLPDRPPRLLQVKKQMSELIARHNCHPLKAGLVLWFQFPFWIGLSMALRNLSWALPARDASKTRDGTERRDYCGD